MPQKGAESRATAAASMPGSSLMRDVPVVGGSTVLEGIQLYLDCISAERGGVDKTGE